MKSDKTKIRSGRRSLLVPGLILITLIACGAAGYAVWQVMTLQESNRTVKVKKVEPPPAPLFLALDTFTVNLINSDDEPDRVLYVGFTLRLPDEDTRRRLSDYLPEVRSRLLLLLSHQSATALATEQGKQDLIKQIKGVLAPPLVAGEPQQAVSDVLFTAFILR